MNIKVDVNVNVSLSEDTLNFIGSLLSVRKTDGWQPVESSEEKSPAEEKTRKPRGKKADAEAAPVVNLPTGESAPSQTGAVKTTEEMKLERRTRVKELREKPGFEARILEIVQLMAVPTADGKKGLDGIPDERHAEFMDRINSITVK